MTYGRSRLWLGITGVGSLVLVAVAILTSDIPKVIFSSEPTGWIQSSIQLSGLAMALAIWMLPFDFLGGFLLPRRHGRSEQTFGGWLGGYLVGVTGQSIVLVLFSTATVQFGQVFGWAAGFAVMVLAMALCLLVRDQAVQWREVSRPDFQRRLVETHALVQSWGIFVPRIQVVEHRDVGFTGGIVGWGHRARIVLPVGWMETMSNQELATTIARRAAAISNGSYQRGLLVALLWSTAGVAVSSWLSGGGFSSVAGLVLTIAAFTLWSFLGLLLLPTLSRSASLAIDHELIQLGAPREWVVQAAASADRLQDDEPRRHPWVEAIFHPVPSVERRSDERPVASMPAWNVARTTVFLSWACFGVLSRAVHCNVGRPELWAMLPSD